MKAWKPLEAAQVAETGEREVPGLLGHLGEARPHLWVGMSQPSSKTQVPAPHSARLLPRALEGVRGPKNSTWRKEETPGAGLGGPLSGGPLPLPLSHFHCSPVCGGSPPAEGLPGLGKGVE